MKKSFEKERIVEENMNVEGFKKSIPTFLILPKNNTDKALIYIPGLNGNGSLIKFLNYKMFDNCYLFSFDMRAQGSNDNKATRFFKKYVQDIGLIINEFKNKYPGIKYLYLCGESWGATLSILTFKKYPKLFNGVICWNMPYDVVDVSSEKGWEKFIKSFKVFITFITSISTYDKAPLVNELTNNKVLRKAILLIKNNKLNNKVILAAWRSFKKAWHFVKNNEELNIKIIQSKEDIMLSQRKLEMISNIKNVKIWEKGFHILTFDDNVNDELFNEISKFVK